MAQSPLDFESMGSHVVHKTPLPSFAKFLSDTGHLHLNIASTTPGTNGDIARHQLSHISHSLPLYLHIPPQATYAPSDPTISQHLDQVARCQSIPQSTVQPSHWQHHNSSPLTRHTSLPPLRSQPSPPEHGYGRVVVTESAVPGRGLCYVYNDGSMCQKTINGDAVNPKWGITKAGKPRKRLGQACNKCREKKVFVFLVRCHQLCKLT